MRDTDEQDRGWLEAYEAMVRECAFDALQEERAGARRRLAAGCPPPERGILTEESASL